MRITCKKCGKEFRTYPNIVKKGNGKYCSKLCFVINRKEKSRIKRICKMCKREFEAPPSAIKRGRKYCSLKCAYKNRKGNKSTLWTGGKTKTKCKQCGKIFYEWAYRLNGGTGKFCSRKCWGKSLRGKKLSPETIRKLCKARALEKNANWQGGKSFEPYGADFSEELKREIRKRDRHKCQMCGVPAKELLRLLHVHHINYIKKDNREENLISLCNSCHGKTHFNRKDWERHLKEVMLECMSTNVS